MVNQLTTNHMFVALLLQYCRNLKELYFSGLSASGGCNFCRILCGWVYHASFFCSRTNQTEKCSQVETKCFDHPHQCNTGSSHAVILPVLH